MFNFNTVDGSCPPEERFDALKRFLLSSLSLDTYMRRHMIREHKSDLSMRYSCTEELVLFNGLAKAALITNCQFPAMMQGNCFGNAFELALQHPELRYVEGWACMEQSMPTHHAWVEHPDGSVSDPTWLTIIQNSPIKTIPGHAARCVYMGVHVPLANHLAWFFEHDTPNLLSFGEMMPKEVLHRGYDAFLEDEIAASDMPEAIGDALARLDRQPRWTLSDDGDHYYRTDDKGETERWFPKHGHKYA